MGRAGRILFGLLTLTLVASAPGGSAAASPGDNGPLAYTGPAARGQYQSYVVNPDGTGGRRLFAGQVESNYSPVWSPDGRWFAFNRFRQLLIARADGSDTRLLDAEAVYEASWSPDGTRLVYALMVNGLRSQLWVINADGSDRHMIHDGPNVSFPAWSPRGDRIAFSQRRPASPGEGYSDTDTEIFTMDVDGGNLTQLTSNTDPNDPSRSYDQSPTWSPDGTRIAFFSSRDGVCDSTQNPICDGDLYVMDADGSDVARLSAPGLEYSPSWSPDGTSLAYSSMTVVGNGYTSPVIHIRDLAAGTVRPVVESQSLSATVDWGAVPGTMPRADLRVTLAVPVDMVGAGSATTYTAAVANGGDSQAVGSEVTFRLPPGATYSGADTPGCAGTDVVRCEIGDLPAGATRTVTITAVGGTPGAHEVSAMATSTTADPDFANNRQATAVAVCTELGTAADDTLVGTGDSDVLCGAGGDDTLKGAGGRDVLIGGRGDDRIDGGAGQDTASYATSARKVSVDLTDRRGRGDGSDRLERVESADGSRYADHLVGSSARNVLDGGGGRDRISGLGGADRLFGGADRDVLAPGPGNDELDGGVGDDLVDYADSSNRVRADLTRGRANAEGDDRLASVEGVRGSPFADELRGSILGDRIVGGDGADSVRAAGGNDWVTGGGGSDELLGGDGNDRFSGGPGADRCEQDYGRGERRQCEKT